MFFEFLHAKPCRIIQKFAQKGSFGSEIGPKVGIWTCPDLPRPVQEDKSLSAKRASPFFFLQKLHLSNLHYEIYHFYKTISFIKQIYDLSTESFVLLSKFMIFIQRKNTWKIFRTYIYMYIYMEYIYGIYKEYP